MLRVAVDFTKTIYYKVDVDTEDEADEIIEALLPNNLPAEGETGIDMRVSYESEDPEIADIMVIERVDDVD